MRILITGGTGLIGRRLLADRLRRGDEVVLVTRDRQRARRRIGTDATKGVSIVEGDPARAGGWPWNHWHAGHGVNFESRYFRPR